MHSRILKYSRHSDSYESLPTLLQSVDSSCHHMGFTTIQEDRSLAVLPGDDVHPPSPDFSAS